MARTRDSALPSVALCGLSLAASLTLSRVFEAGPWRVAVLGAASIPHLLVFVGRVRGWASRTVVASVVGLGAAYCVWIVAPSTTWWGLPTWATGDAISAAFADGPQTLRSASVPVAPEGAALLMAVAIVWAMAATAEWLATRLDATVGALAPSLVVYIVISSLGRGPWMWTAVCYTASAAVFLAVQNETLTASRRTWFEQRTRRRTAAIGATVAVTAIVISAGALAAPQLPGASADPWFDYRDLGDGGGRGRLQIISPLVDIRSSLLQQDPIEVFQVTADTPQYWRLIGLEDFDGRFWGVSDDSAPANSVLREESRPFATETIDQRFQLTALGGHLLPAAFSPVTVTGDARVLPNSSTLLHDDPNEPGFTYEARSQVPSPTPDDLRRATRPSPSGFEELTSLPGDFPPAIRELAVAVAGAAQTDFDRLVALQQFFREEFDYSVDVEPGHSTSDIERFVFDTRAGYCEQFAGTFAAMARSLGFPARVAVGYQSGTFDPSIGAFRVTGLDAHAWPEVYLTGAGWMRFEPTPTRFEPTAGDYTGTGAERAAATAPDGEGSDPSAAAPTPVPDAADDQPTPPSESPNLDELLGGADVGGGSQESDATPAPAWRRLVDVAVLDAPQRTLAILVAAAGLVTAVGATAIVGAKWNRRRRRRRDPSARRRLHGAWSEATDRLSEAGIEREVTLTPTEFALRRAAARGAGGAGPALMDLARNVSAALYAPEEPDESLVEAAWCAVEEIDEHLRTTATPGTRLRRRLSWATLREQAPV